MGQIVCSNLTRKEEVHYTSRKSPNDRIRGHKLLTKELAERLPRHMDESKGYLDLVAYVKYFHPWSGWYWYAMEFDGVDTFYGVAFGPYVEFGSFSLAELEATRDSRGLPVERDLYFTPKSLGEIKREHQQREGAEARIYCL